MSADDDGIDLTDDDGTGAGSGGEVPASTGGVVDLDRVVGNIPVVLVFLADPEDDAGRQVLAGLGERLVEFGRDRVQVLAVSPIAQQELVDGDVDLTGNARVLADPAGAVAGRFGGAYEQGTAVTVLIDADGEIADRWSDPADADLAGVLLDRLSALSSGR